MDLLFQCKEFRKNKDIFGLGSYVDMDLIRKGICLVRDK